MEKFNNPIINNQTEIDFNIEDEKTKIAKEHHISPAAIEFLTFDGKTWYMKGIPLSDYDNLYTKDTNERYN